MQTCHNTAKPKSTVTFEKLILFQVVKKHPAFTGTQKFIAAFTGAIGYLDMTTDNTCSCAGLKLRL
jgi:ribosomal protein L31